MPSSLLDLASQVFVFLATFKRNAQRGLTENGDRLHEQVVQILRDLDTKAQAESAILEHWNIAKKALVFLIDEIMINTEWEYRGWWGDNSLEADVLNHPQKMRGVLFFDEFEKAKQLYENAPQSRKQNYDADLLTIFYVCLRFGFEGKYAGQPQELKREIAAVASKIGGKAVQSREYFSDAYKHTIEIPPIYQTAMRLATLGAIALGFVILVVGFREVLWSDLLNELKQSASDAGSFFAQDT